MAADKLTIVGIGASAGGLDAFHSFFANMPDNSGMAFVVLLHLPADRPSLLPDILARWTRMAVVAVCDGDTVEPNTVYVPPPRATTVLRDGRLFVSQPPPDSPREHRPIDGFFDTLAASQGALAVGIVLSGNGSDGALGLKAIKACHGLTMAQGIAADTADTDDGPEFSSMPAAAVATGTVDLVAPAHALPGHLLRLRGLTLDAELAASADEDVEAARLRICAILRAQVGHDFSGYKSRTFLRRVNRRMQVRGLPALRDYVHRLESDHDEAMLLFRDLLIRVTSFFRDADAFEVIERVVVPRLFDGRHADGSVRVWVPGCATGEEAYSLAILLREHLDGIKGAPKVQIFGTDIDGPAIDTARMGRYPSVLLNGLSDDRRERFFSRSESGYTVRKEIRDLCTFSPHSLVRDPPFSRIDLVSCRNLLIYLEADLQASVLPAFHYSLSPGGMLILGISESTSRHEDLFEPLDKSARIFQRRDVRSPPLQITEQRLERLRHPERATQPVTRRDRRRLPAATGGNTSRNSDAGPPPAALSAGTLLQRLKQAAAQRLVPDIEGAASLRAKLQQTRDELQTLTEEHVTAVEELRSSNEELHSVNEELQSTNEELETSKEEIQSVNEELHTLNVQLTEKLDELDDANSDLKNLLDSTQIATVFLDRHLLIRGFTPAINTLYNLIPSDVGRPLSDIAGSLGYTTLREDARQVFDTLAPVERRLSRSDGSAHFIMRMLPYRAPDSTVTGSLLTFLDVTGIVQAEQHQRLLVDELNHRVRNMLTVVISMATQTLRRSTGLEEFGDAFLGRVHALSTSYTLLSRENWMSIALQDVIKEELRPFVSQDPTNVQLTGPEVQLAPAGALAMGMAIHELATNAVKYGALSVRSGRLSIAWQVLGEVPDQALEIEWREEGGPEVHPPEQRGFGTILIERGFSHELSGHASLDFRPSGLVARLRAPMQRVSIEHPRVAV